MNKQTSWIAAAGVVGVLAVASSSACAQSTDAAMWYSDGVHAYFAGNSTRAEQYLSAAIDDDPHDPRPYYFRALSLLRMGRLDEARGDMHVGATLEARRPHRFAVGAALVRVQGSHRLMLEQFRRQARLDEAAARQQRDQQRYEQFTDRETEVLRRPLVVPLDQLLQPGDPAVAIEERTRPLFEERRESSSAPPAADDDPFADDPEEPGQAEAETSDEAAAPFGLFSEGAADPLTPAEETETPADDAAEPTEAGDTTETDPFGTIDDDPFGDL